MNKRISDLLDHYADESVDLAGDSPLSSARIKELTMNKITEEKKPRLRRLPVRIAAAAAVAAALTVTAFTARVLGAGDLMQGLFQKWTDEPLTATQVETLNGMGRVFDGSEEYSVTSNGATITPIAALADEDAYYLRLRIEAPEGTVLPDLDAETQGRYVLTGKDSEGRYQDLHLEVPNFYYSQVGLSKAYVTPGMREVHHARSWNYYTLPDSDPTDNVKELVLTLYSHEYKDIPYNDGVKKWLTVEGLWIELPYSEEGEHYTYTEVFRGTFTFDIGSHFVSQVATIDCGGAEWADPATGQVNLVDTMKLSPLGLKFEFRSNLRQDNGRLSPQHPGDVRIVMKDGSALSLEPGNAIYLTDTHRDPSDPYFQVTPDLLTETPEWELGTYWAFDAPLDLSQVDYVQLGEDHIYYITTE
ncbi:MAG: hypothetical protein HDT33_03065 [Clostridiales bacterium]|nr:hypothetical protein [Clostridiales bacterium]